MKHRFLGGEGQGLMKITSTNLPREVSYVKNRYIVSQQQISLLTTTTTKAKMV